MIVEITQQHIDAGTVADDCFCPAALALKGTGLFKTVSVGHTEIVTTSLQNGVVFYEVPMELKLWIDMYDSALPVKPITFDLELSKGTPFSEASRY